jgi:hypothetical protein
MESTVEIGRTVHQQQERHNVTESEKLVTGVETEAMLKNTTARESWRIFGIMAEFVEATERLASDPPGVSMFGSARTNPTPPTTS